jgi:hypothetical protein
MVYAPNVMISAAIRGAMYVFIVELPMYFFISVPSLVFTSWRAAVRPGSGQSSVNTGTDSRMNLLMAGLHPPQPAVYLSRR